LAYHINKIKQSSEFLPIDLAEGQHTLINCNARV